MKPSPGTRRPATTTPTPAGYGSTRNAAELYRRWGCCLSSPEWLKKTVPDHDWESRSFNAGKGTLDFSVARTSTFGQLDVSTVIKYPNLFPARWCEKLYSRMVMDTCRKCRRTARALLLLPS
ncbi:MAG: hypothetical protein R3B47_09120 [Bacteroidia bacterium]